MILLSWIVALFFAAIMDRGVWSMLEYFGLSGGGALTRFVVFGGCLFLGSLVGEHTKRVLEKFRR